jgi:hypothetical protein
MESKPNNSSFWKTMPVIVNNEIQSDTFKPIFSPEFLIKRIENNLSRKSDILNNYKYVIFEKSQYPDTFLDKIKIFFDKYYLSDSTKLCYDTNIFKYFTKNAIVISLSDVTTNDEVGFIMGRKINLNINSKPFTFFEVCFLCIAKKYRNQQLAPILIDLITKESVQRYNITISTYTISNHINSPKYGYKHIYHRPLNISKLINCEFLPKNFKDEYIENFCVEPNTKLVYLNSLNLIPQTMINIIHKKLNKFQSSKYAIYKEFSKTELRHILQNKSFHNFIVLDKNDIVQDFISFYEITVYNHDLDVSYKNSSIYIMFFEQYQQQNVFNVLESVGKYCKDNNIIDVLSLYDIFPIENYYKNLKFLKGQGFSNYYMFNYKMAPIPNHLNGYTPI